MRIAVYAICKNESQFVDRWMDSMSEADQVVVLDTGSTDDTVERLKKRGAQVTVELISPWRFDVARNRSLDLVSEDTDICVCTDLDEVFHPGWRAALERAWQPGAGQATYRYTWSFNPDGSGLVTSTTNELSAQDNNYSVLTTDIASNKLQSGILINTDGQVIGLSLQDFNPAEENNTLTAVSISDLSPAIEKLESGADVPYIGITCTTVTEKIANRYNIPKGVYIKQVTMDSPAFVSGLQSGDVIVAVNNTEVSNVSAYNTQLMKQKPEDTCNLKVKRKGSNGYTEITCQVKIGVMN